MAASISTVILYNPPLTNIGPVIEGLPQMSKLSSVQAAPKTYSAPGALTCSEPP